MRDLSTLTNQELETFFNSFTFILSDIDGVIRHFLFEIPGANDAIRSFKKLRKRCVFVSNNTALTIDTLYNELNEIDLDVDKEDLVTPIEAIVSYLKDHDLTKKKIFVLGMEPLKQALIEAGFTLAEKWTDYIQTGKQFSALASIDDESIAAVVADIDLNINHVNLQKAATCLHRPEVLFLAGTRDEKFPLGVNKFTIGSGGFIKILENVTDRQAINMAKPSPNFNEYIVKRFQIDDSSKVLFIGDSIPADMGFAAIGGYKKLLVLSGVSSRSSIDEWKFPEEFRPDFYVESVKVVHDLIVRVFGDQL